MNGASLRAAVAAAAVLCAAVAPAGAQQPTQPGSAAPTVRPAAPAAQGRAPGACPAGQPDCPGRGAQRRRAQAAAAAPLVLAPASAEQLEAASQVHYGRYLCEFNQVLDIDRNDANAGYANLKFKSQNWVMAPVLSRSGAIRLEDVRGEALLVQIAFKSMLMNVKSGQRLVDECIHEAQRAEKENSERPAGAEKPSPDAPPTQSR